MAQNITTLLDKTEITAADIRALESTVDNFLYLVHGTGPNRDKKFNLKQLRVWLSVLTELTLMKAFTGGHSTVELDGESINLSAEGTAVTDNSRMELSRTGLSVRRSSEGGETHVSFDSGKVEVSFASSSLSYKWVFSNDGLKFYINESTNASAEFSVDPSTGVITLSGPTSINLGCKLYAPSGIEGDIDSSDVVTTDSVVPKTEGRAINLGSVGGGVNLVGPTTGFKGAVKTESITPLTTGNNISIGESPSQSGNGGVLFNGLLRVNHGIQHQSVVLNNATTSSIAQTTLDAVSTSTVYVKQSVANVDIDLTQLLPNAEIGQRFIFISDRNDNTYSMTFTIDTNSTVFRKFMPGGCEFIVVGKTPLEFRPIG